MDRFVVISADCHAVGRPEEFVEYLDSQYVDAYRESLRQRASLRSRKRSAEREKKRSSVRYWLLVLSLIATAVIVTIALTSPVAETTSVIGPRVTASVR